MTGSATRVATLAALAALAVAGCTDGGGARSDHAAAPTSVAELSSAPVDDHAGPEFPLRVPSGRRPVVRAGDDWTVPAWARPAAYSGFFSESALPADHVQVRSVDVSWAQIQPTEDGALDLTSSGEAQGMFFDPLGEQLAEQGPYWVRLFASGVDWAPPWVVDKCGVGPVGTDYDGQQHLPIWDDCVWTELSATWRRLLVDQGVLGDPDFRFAYVPGGFTWVEYDYEMISAAVRKGLLTEADYLAWYDRMLDDLAEIAGPQVGQLVFTGEDYPWGPFGKDDDLLATRAVRRGLGVRTGITEESNFHLSETPAYGSHVGPDGHLVVRRPDPTGLQVFGTENECYVDCGFAAQDPSYDVVQSNLKALQLRMNWVYVVPGDSLLDPNRQHWDWVRLSLGRTPETSADAWVSLRDAEDTFWRDTRWPFPDRRWRGRPFVRNLERWLVQVEAPGAVAHRSRADVHRGDPTPENGVAFEGLRTDRVAGDTALAFRVDPRFLPAGGSRGVLVKVTFLDRGRGSFRLREAHGSTPAVRLRDTGTWRTATWRLRLGAGHLLPHRTDLRIEARGSDLTVRFVRVVRLRPPPVVE
ncbi:MAG: hypothetical protein U0R80_06820 [Nocardioidaceae bacterium]